MTRLNYDQFLGAAEAKNALKTPRKPEDITSEEIATARTWPGPGPTDWWQKPELTNQEIAEALSRLEELANDPRLQALTILLRTGTN